MNYGTMTVQETLRELGIRAYKSSLSGWMKIKCPFHSDNSPSFSINLNTGEWKCWSGCGGSKDLVDLVVKITHVDKNQARRDILNKLVADSRSLSEILSPSLVVPPKQEPVFYIRNKVPRYFLNRGFTLETAKNWQIGYEPDLKGVAIPVKEEGRIVGLITRTITGLPMRYVTSTGFIKSNYLFGIDHVSSTVKSIVLVEGPLNAIWLHQNGYSAVAIMGTDISKEQYYKLTKRFNEVILAFDNDLPLEGGFSPGKEATIKAIHKLKGLTTYVLPLPEGKDVQNLSKAELDISFSLKTPSWHWMAENIDIKA